MDDNICCSFSFLLCFIKILPLSESAFFGRPLFEDFALVSFRLSTEGEEEIAFYLAFLANLFMLSFYSVFFLSLPSLIFFFSDMPSGLLIGP